MVTMGGIIWRLPLLQIKKCKVNNQTIYESDATVNKRNDQEEES
jgi:hypothetical protein